MASIKEKTSMAIHPTFSVLYRRIYKFIFSKRKSQMSHLWLSTVLTQEKLFSFYKISYKPLNFPPPARNVVIRSVTVRLKSFLIH